jgi:methyl-accepting chemotaxis protein
VIEQVQSLPDQFESVRCGMSEQVSAADQIVESMNQLGTGASQVVLALKQLNTISHQLAESSGGLGEHVRQFNVREEE